MREPAPLGLPAALLAWCAIAIWLGALVLIPFAALVDQSTRSTVDDRASAAWAVDRLWQELAVAQWDFDHTADPERRNAADLSIRELAGRIRTLEALPVPDVVVRGFDAWRGFDDGPFASLAATLGRALAVTGICLLLADPIAVATALSPHRRRARLLLAALALPLALDPVLRVHALDLIFAGDGLPARGLAALGLRPASDAPLLDPPTRLFLTLVHLNLPLAVLPLHLAMTRLDRRLIEVARDLGASAARIRFEVILPQTRLAHAVAAVIVFTLVAGSDLVPSLIDPAGGNGWSASLLVRQVFQFAEPNLAAAHALVIAAGAGLLAAALFFGLAGRGRGLVRPRARR